MILSGDEIYANDPLGRRNAAPAGRADPEPSRLRPRVHSAAGFLIVLVLRLVCRADFVLDSHLLLVLVTTTPFSRPAVGWTSPVKALAQLEQCCRQGQNLFASSTFNSHFPLTRVRTNECPQRAEAKVLKGHVWCVCEVGTRCPLSCPPWKVYWGSDCSSWKGETPEIRFYRCETGLERLSGLSERKTLGYFQSHRGSRYSKFLLKCVPAYRGPVLR